MKMILKVKDGVDLDVLLKYGFKLDVLLKYGSKYEYIGSTYDYYDDCDCMDLFINSDDKFLILEYSTLSKDTLNTILKMIKDGILEIIEEKEEVKDVI